MTERTAPHPKRELAPEVPRYDGYLRPGQRLDHAPIALIPERSRPDGPVTTQRIRRTVRTYAMLAGAGALAARLLGDRPAANMALGAIAPGAGYLSAGRPIAYAGSQLGFATSLLAWLGSGNLLAPVATWAGTAVHSGRRPATHQAAQKAVPVAAAGLLVAGWGAREVAHRKALKRRDANNQLLREIQAERRTTSSVTTSSRHPVSTSKELTPDELALTRWALDRALQPVEDFEGFNRIDQFQTASVRYQVTYLGHALSTLQFERTPSFHGYLSSAQRNLIDKWMERICWAYWSKESLWGHLRYNPDPVPRDNIMLTGWLGYQLASYVSNTGDDRYEREGAITFRHPRGMEYAYGIHSLTHALVDNFERSPYTFFACEPNWIYTLCNGYGILPVPMHDRLYGTDFSSSILPAFRRALEQEFLTVDGRTVVVRSAATGLAIPAMNSLLSDCSLIWQLAPIYPDISAAMWEIMRNRWIHVPSSGPVQIDFKSLDKVDVGNYQAGVPATAFSAISWAALEMGDTELAARLRVDAETQLEPVIEEGVKHYQRASVLSNAALLGAYAAGVGTHRRRVTEGMPGQTMSGPVLDDCAYPDVLVARAVCDGSGLELVLRPGGGPTRQRLGLARLQPGRSYIAKGTVESTVVADAAGRAALHVDLHDRTDVRLDPADGN
jgi:hypothetical protein